MKKIQSIGAQKAQAKRIFFLPTPPKGRYDLDESGHLKTVDVNGIIQQDGNHWRKILVIMAKLSTSEEMSWRQYKNEYLLRYDERIEFSLPLTFDNKVIYFFCGGQMQSQLILEQLNVVSLNERDTLRVCANKILCPYFDYRQYPNIDIEVTRMYLNKMAE